MKSESRPDIVEVLKHEAFTKNLRFFNEPLTQSQFSLLYKNFMLNSGGGIGKVLPTMIRKAKNMNTE